MLAKLTIKNFFTRFHTYLICLGMFILSIVVAVLVFIGGMQLVLSMQGGVLVEEVQNYFLTSFQIKDILEVLNLSILKRVYTDIMIIAGPNSKDVTTGMFIVIAVCVFIVFGCYKGSSSLVSILNKKKLSDKNTKSGVKPLIINLLITLLFSALAAFLMSLWAWSGLIVFLIYLLIDSLENIFSIHYVYFSNVKLKEMFKNKAVLKIMSLYFVSDLILLVIAALLWLISPIIAVFILVPLLAYNETNITYTVVTYYKERKSANNLTKK